MKTIEEAYEDYHHWIKVDKERLCIDLERSLKMLGMWQKDVIRNHDGAVGQFKVVVPKTPGQDPHIEFYKYSNMGRLSNVHSGFIPYKDTEKYLTNVFSVKDRRH